MDLDGLGRFADPAVLILSSLAGGDKHGYALVGDIQDFAGVRLGPGTLYGALSRLEKRGLVEALAAQERRHPYRLTGRGAAALRDYLTHAQGVAKVGLLRLAQGA
jgi:DNA-binding PadR family transcriptional regulator